MEDFYELFGVSEDAPKEEIDRAWRQRVRRYHPDVNDDTRATAQFKTLQTAHEVLTDDTERAAYDRLGHETYVKERLDGLPTARHPATAESRTTDDGAARDGPDADEHGGGSADGSDRRGAAGGSRSGRSGPRSRGSGRSTGRTGTNGRRRASDARTRAADTGTTDGRGRNVGTEARAEATSSARRRRRPRRPLAYGWAMIALVTAVYLLGLRAYLGVNAATLATLTEASPATAPSLLRSYNLVAPGTFALDAAATGALLPLAFVVGAVGLAAGFLVVVVSFGRGAAYLYAVGGLTPAAALAIGPVVAAPDGAVLVLAVVVPVTTAALFLVDVGRELLAGP